MLLRISGRLVTQQTPTKDADIDAQASCGYNARMILQQTEAGMEREQGVLFVIEDYDFANIRRSPC